MQQIQDGTLHIRSGCEVLKLTLEKPVGLPMCLALKWNYNAL